jgi:hypothetical protein
VVYACNPSYSRDIGRRITVEDWPVQNEQEFEKNLKAKKGWRHSSNGRVLV